MPAAGPTRGSDVSPRPLVSPVRHRSRLLCVGSWCWSIWLLLQLLVWAASFSASNFDIILLTRCDRGRRLLAVCARHVPSGIDAPALSGACGVRACDPVQYTRWLCVHVPPDTRWCGIRGPRQDCGSVCLDLCGGLYVIGWYVCRVRPTDLYGGTAVCAQPMCTFGQYLRRVRGVRVLLPIGCGRHGQIRCWGLLFQVC